MSDSQAHKEDTALLKTTEPSKRGKFTAALVALALTGTIVLATSPNGTAALRGAAFRNCGTRIDGGPKPYRDGECWDGTFQQSCGSAYDCVSIDGKRWDDPSRIAVCRNKRCQNGKSTASCGRSVDCIPPGGAAKWGVCRHGRCQVGTREASCGRNYDCICNRCSVIGGDSGKCLTNACYVDGKKSWTSNTQN